MNQYTTLITDPLQLQAENQRLNTLAQNQALEIEDLRKKIQALESSSGQGLSSDSRNLQIQFNAERASYEAQISQLQYRVKDLESQLSTYAADSERLMTANNQRNAENDALIKRVQELEDFYKVGELQSQLEFYKANTFDIKQLAIRYGADKAADQSQIKQLKQMNENYKNELQKVYELMSQRKSDYDQLQQQFERLRKELEDVSKKSRSSSVGISQDRYDTLAKENEQLRATNTELRTQLDQSVARFTEKGKELAARIQEVEGLRNQYEAALSKVGGAGAQQRYY